VQKGMNSATYAGGRLSHLEKPIWYIQRYLARKIRESMNAPATHAPPAVYEAACG
jgi:hypothetical protein